MKKPCEECAKLKEEIADLRAREKERFAQGVEQNRRMYDLHKQVEKLQGLKSAAGALWDAVQALENS